MARTAKVYPVGAGPGKADRLARNAWRLLEQADIILYRRLVRAEVLALANPQATFIFAGKPQLQKDEIRDHPTRMRQPMAAGVVA